MTTHLPDGDFFDRNAHTYLNAQLTASELARFEALLDHREWSERLTRLRDFRGLGQAQLARLRLSPEQHHALHALLVGADEWGTSPYSEEPQTSPGSAGWTRHAVAGLLGAGLLAAGLISAYQKSTSGRRSAHPLKLVTYEAVALERDTAGERIYFPTGDHDQLRDYVIGATLDQPFSSVLAPAETFDLTPVGASLIEYGSDSLVVVRYRRQGRPAIMYFSFAGEVEQLPGLGAPQQHAARTVYTLGSEHLNLVVWQYDRRTVAVVASSAAVADLLNYLQ